MVISLFFCPKTTFAADNTAFDPPPPGAIARSDQRGNPSSGKNKEVREVYLNREKKGEFIVLISGRDVLINQSDFQNLGFKNLPEAVTMEGEKYISLQALTPAVSFKTDETKLSVYITADPKLLTPQVVDIAHKRQYPVLFPEYNSAFLNYALSYSAGEHVKFQSLNFPFETGIRLGGCLAYSNFSYHKSESEEKFVRLMTNISRDDRKAMFRVTAGDLIASSGGHLGGAGNIGGIGITRQFSFDPYFISYPSMGFSGYLQAPSEVDLYVNGILIKRERFSSGEFDFLNLPLATGLQDVEVVIKDEFGREERIKYPFFFTAGILKPGLHDYSYGLGFIREKYMENNFDYGIPVLLFYHKYGLSKIFTLGARGEADKDFFNVGPSASFLIGKAGVIEASAAASYADSRAGWGGSIDYFFTDNRFGGKMSFKYLSREYHNLSWEPARGTERFESLLGLSYYQKIIGSLSANASLIEKYEYPYALDLTLYLNRNLFRDLSLLLRETVLRQAGNTTNEIFAGVNFILGKNHSGSLSYQRDTDKQNENFRETLYLQKSPPLGEGIGYRLFAENANNDWSGRTDGNAEIDYRGRYGIYSAAYRNFAGRNSYDLALSGGAVFIDRSFFLTRPVTDSFTLVKVANLKNVTVGLNSQESGKTDRKGELIVPELLSYNDNKISIQDNDIPMIYRIGGTEMYISPPYRGGGIVNFDVKKVQDVTGHIFLLENGRKLTTDYASLTMTIDNQTVESVIGKGGEFYLEDIKPGQYLLNITFEDKDCGLTITVPESNDMVIDLGGLICKIK